MKKLFLLTCMVLTALVSIAQTKRVAILEVLDRENKLTYSQKLVLRSNMARAITNTDGYEAYDRSDVDVIMSEQDFQRTGLVSNDQIRKLGELTGVSLILVTEGVLIDANKIFVTAKILNVETGRVDMTDNTTMGLESGAIQEGCNEMARKLFGVGAISSQASKYYVSALGGHHYSYRGKTLDEKAYMNFLQNNCPEAYAKHRNGRIMSISGWIAMGVGLAMTGIGAGLIANVKIKDHAWDEQIKTGDREQNKISKEMQIKYGSVQKGLSAYFTHSWEETYEMWIREGSHPQECAEMKAAMNAMEEYDNQTNIARQAYYDAENMKPLGIVFVSTGPVVATAASIPLLYFGSKAKKQSVNIYNNSCASASAKTYSLNLTAGQNGLGVAMNF